MRYSAIILAGSLAACASHNAPPTASAESVHAATNTPTTGPSFAPASHDGLAVAPVDARWPRTASVPPAVPPTSATPKPPRNDSLNDTASAPTTGNATALPAQSPPISDYEADNSRVNARDRNGTTLTPMDQGSSESDRKITQQIRQAVVGDSSLSFNAKNVKIITIRGKVTLRGVVRNDDERIKVAAAARRVAGDAQVENYLETTK